LELKFKLPLSGFQFALGARPEAGRLVFSLFSSISPPIYFLLKYLGCILFGGSRFDTRAENKPQFLDFCFLISLSNCFILKNTLTV
jgi:hypothetical protein